MIPARTFLFLLLAAVVCLVFTQIHLEGWFAGENGGAMGHLDPRQFLPPNGSAANFSPPSVDIQQPSTSWSPKTSITTPLPTSPPPSTSTHHYFKRVTFQTPPALPSWIKLGKPPDVDTTDTPPELNLVELAASSHRFPISLGQNKRFFKYSTSVSSQNRILPDKGIGTIESADIPPIRPQFMNPSVESRFRQVVRDIGAVSYVHPYMVADPLQPLRHLSVVDSDSVTRVIISTYFRAGSTFFGDVLQQSWKTFYHFEPLHYMSDGLRISEDRVPEARDLLDHLFNCNFSAAVDYVRWAQKESHDFLFRRNTFLWSLCRFRPQTCFSPTYIAEVCSRAAVQVMKVVRLQLRHVEEFLETNPHLKVKVVHLLRDPRGIITSRKVLPWCNRTKCGSYTQLCQEMTDDIQSAKRLREKLKNNFIQIRYEDLALDPDGVTKELFERLGLNFSPKVRLFLETHTRKTRRIDAQDPYSTRRNSTTVPFLWRAKLRLRDVQMMQERCPAVYHEYGYLPIRTQQDLWLNATVPLAPRTR